MKKLNYLLLTVFVFMISTSFNAQTVDEIIENYIENTGGSENWQNVKAIKMSASINQMGMEIPIEMVQSENKMYTKISIQGQEIKQGVFDGETLWSTNFMSMKPEKSDQEDVDNVKNELDEFPDPFLNYKEKGFSVELMGTETVDGSDAFKVKLTKKPMLVDGEEVPNVSIYYFDSENFVPIMVHEEVMSGPGKGMIMESKMSDYQEVEGLYLPFSMTQGVKDQPGQPITINSIELNPSLDDSEFEFPEVSETPETSQPQKGNGGEEGDTDGKSEVSDSQSKPTGDGKPMEGKGNGKGTDSKGDGREDGSGRKTRISNESS